MGPQTLPQVPCHQHMLLHSRKRHDREAFSFGFWVLHVVFKPCRHHMCSDEFRHPIYKHLNRTKLPSFPGMMAFPVQQAKEVALFLALAVVSCVICTEKDTQAMQEGHSACRVQ